MYNYLHSEITDEIIKAFYIVYNKIGYGILEKVDESAMMIEHDRLGSKCERQKLINVIYDDAVIGEYYADILINELVIIELKAAESLCYEHECQFIIYLKASELEVGLLLNFGKEPQLCIKVLTVEFKNHSRS
jgi:GxxExxY protein